MLSSIVRLTSFRNRLLNLPTVFIDCTNSVPFHLQCDRINLWKKVGYKKCSIFIKFLGSVKDLRFQTYIIYWDNCFIIDISSVFCFVWAVGASDVFLCSRFWKHFFIAVVIFLKIYFFLVFLSRSTAATG